MAGLYFEGDGSVGVAVGQTGTSSTQVIPQIAPEEAENTEIRPLPDVDQLVDDEKAQFLHVPAESSRVNEDPTTHSHRLDTAAPDPHHHR